MAAALESEATKDVSCQLRNFLDEYSAGPPYSAISLARLETILTGPPKKKDDEDGSEDEEESDDEELLNLLFSHPRRPISPKMLAVFLRARRPDGFDEHPIQILIADFTSRRLKETHQELTEDEFVGLLATLIAHGSFTMNDDIPRGDAIEILRDGLEDEEEESEGLIERILAKLEGHPAPNKMPPRPTDIESARTWFAAAEAAMAMSVPGSYPKGLEEALGFMDGEADTALAQVITFDFAKNMLLEWGDTDVVNGADHRLFVEMLEHFPLEILEKLGLEIMRRVSTDFLDDGEFLDQMHESYPEFLESVCQALAPKIPTPVAAYAREVVLPRLQEANVEDDNDAFYAVLWLFEIHNANPACVKPIAVEVLAAGSELEGGWEALAEAIPDLHTAAMESMTICLRDALKDLQKSTSGEDGTEVRPSKRLKTDAPAAVAAAAAEEEE